MENTRRVIGTKKMVIAGMLGAIAIVLGATGLGFIPMPNLAGRATIMHIPVVLGGILQGPMVGGLTGLIFGVYSFLTPTGAIPADPIVRILPRVLIGITSYYTFWMFRKHVTFASIMAAIVGTLTNTIGYLGLAVLFGYLPFAAAVAIVVSNTIFEVILAAVVTVALVKALDNYRETR